MESTKRLEGILAASLVAILSMFCHVLAAKRIVIDNPYQGIVWTSGTAGSAWERHKGNFHTHSTESDGSMNPATVIDHYQGKGYTVLALTDHNNNTWPWSDWSRDPATLGMVGISANEFSTGHHRNSLFNTIDGDPGSDVANSFDEVVDSNGIAVLNHPGRYTYATSWYTDLYQNYSMLFGLEVFNQGDRYSGDRDKWDAILTALMPDRPVWGLSNDDMHSTSHLFGNYNVLFMDSLSEGNVRSALEQGQFYFCYESGRSGDAKAPGIDSIIVDTASATITVWATNYTQIQWISGGSSIGTDATIACNSHFTESSPAMYLRARLTGAYGETHTQPFGIGFEDADTSSGFAQRPDIKGFNIAHLHYNGRGLFFEARKGAEFSVSLTDIMGRRSVGVSGVGNGPEHLSVDMLPTGCYVLRGTVAGRSFARKIAIAGGWAWTKNISVNE